jgi:iron-sulfur cluster assembly accessory protein
MNTLTIPHKQAVTLSPAAQEHFQSIASGRVVKFGVEGGGCAGFQYFWRILDSRDELYADDEVQEFDDFVFAVDGASLMMLIGTHVDYVADITGRHIEVHNPLATAGCGCGVSVRFS